MEITQRQKIIFKTIVEEFIGKSRAFIKIQEGCDFRCSYCIIPYVRGDARSYSEDKILEQVTTLAANGFGEFILTGEPPRLLMMCFSLDKSEEIATEFKTRVGFCLNEDNIDTFVKEPFYKVTLTGDGFTAVSENFKEETEARRLAESCQGEKAVIVKVEKKQKKTIAAAYNMT